MDGFYVEKKLQNSKKNSKNNICFSPGLLQVNNIRQKEIWIAKQHYKIAPLEMMISAI